MNFEIGKIYWTIRDYKGNLHYPVQGVCKSDIFGDLIIDLVNNDSTSLAPLYTFASKREALEEYKNQLVLRKNRLMTQINELDEKIYDLMTELDEHT